MEKEKTSNGEHEAIPDGIEKTDRSLISFQKGKGVSVCDNQHDFAWFLDTVKLCRKKRVRFLLIDSGVFDRFHLEWLLEAGADLYTSDESRPDFPGLEGLLKACRKGRSLLAFFLYGSLNKEEEDSSVLFNLLNLGRGGAYLHVSNREHEREISHLNSLAQSCRDGGSRLVYYHHGPLEQGLVELGKNGAWVHISDESIKSEDDRMLLVELALSADSSKSGLVLHMENEMSFPLLEELQKARAHILFKKKHIDFKSPLKKLEQTAAKRKLDYRAYYLHPTVFP